MHSVDEKYTPALLQLANDSKPPSGPLQIRFRQTLMDLMVLFIANRLCMDDLQDLALDRFSEYLEQTYYLAYNGGGLSAIIFAKLCSVFLPHTPDTGPLPLKLVEGRQPCGLKRLRQLLVQYAASRIDVYREDEGFMKLCDKDADFQRGIFYFIRSGPKVKRVGRSS